MNIDYKKAYECLLEMSERGMLYSIERLVGSDEYDGCLLTGDHFYLNDFAGYVKKYGYETVEFIVREKWERWKEEQANEVRSDEGKS